MLDLEAKSNKKLEAKNITTDKQNLVNLPWSILKKKI